MDLGRLRILILFLCVGLLAGCGVRPKEYTLRGEVVRLDPKIHTAAIKHGEIVGWMEAMTMEFPVHDPKEYEKLTVGKQITATVYVSNESYWLGNIQPAGAPVEAQPIRN